MRTVTFTIITAAALQLAIALQPCITAIWQVVYLIRAAL